MNKLRRIQAINRYYKITRFYDFLKNIATKGAITLFIAVWAFVLLDYFVLDMNALLNSLVNNYSTALVFSVFFTSETILGLIPPEIFIAWSSKMSSPWLYLSILAGLSYLGGICAYFLGKLIAVIPSVKIYLETKISIHITNLKKWGGFFVIVGALLPLPHSIVSFACGLINYKFKYYALWALFRFLRFLIYALAIFQML